MYVVAHEASRLSSSGCPQSGQSGQLSVHVVRTEYAEGRNTESSDHQIGRADEKAWIGDVVPDVIGQ